MVKKFFSFEVTGYLHEQYLGDKKALKTPFERKINIVAPSAKCAEEVIRNNYGELNKTIPGTATGEIIDSIKLIDEQIVNYVVTVS